MRRCIILTCVRAGWHASAMTHRLTHVMRGCRYQSYKAACHMESRQLTKTYRCTMYPRREGLSTQLMRHLDSHCGRRPVMCTANPQSKMQGLYGTSSQRCKEGECGRIDVIVGPMFAGKTSELLQRVAQMEVTGQNVLVIKSDKDVRYSDRHVTSHDGKKRECHAVSTLAEVKQKLLQEYQSSPVIAIDEAQFFSDLIQFCTNAADEDHKHVIIAGLDGDFLRNRFGQVLDVMPLADSVTKLSATCFFCSRENSEKQNPAVFSLRLTSNMNQEEIGGAESYVAACRRHYVQHMYTARGEVEMG